jgi:hypothetical protein
MTENLRIESAAIQDVDGKVWTLPPPNRHRDVIEYMRESGYDGPVFGTEQQGFLLNDGSFCKRYDAMKVARQANQFLDGKPSGSVLNTEDLW